MHGAWELDVRIGRARGPLSAPAHVDCGLGHRPSACPARQPQAVEAKGARSALPAAGRPLRALLALGLTRG